MRILSAFTVMLLSIIGAIYSYSSGYSVAYMVFFASAVAAFLMLGFELEMRARAIHAAMRRHPAGSGL